MQHTVTVKPSAMNRKLAAVSERQAYDELVIHWNGLPGATKATLYFPEWNVDDILRLANTLRQRPDLLKKVDAHTLECVVTDISYIPVLKPRKTPGTRDC
ncbi:hypothetical protein LP419_38655 [Massilia sp. H-1]|nr:hypothetical protein LP419_38655 [Massilia sp. H-1]